jgi:nucleoside-diphosphate-sugar epimerase
MKVLVTGGSGIIGRYVVRELVAAGHEVTNVGRSVLAASEKTICRYIRMDLTDVGAVYQALSMAEAEVVIHLGAWADAGIVTHSRTYADNVSSTYNLFQTCADMGIKRVISASSAQVYGLAKYAPRYVPMDEAHELRPVNCYALSKIAGEQAADYFIKNYGMTILSFRFMGVRTPAQLGPEIERLAKDPKIGTFLLWTRTDARDSAVACRLAMEKQQVPSGIYNITGTKVVLDEPTMDLVRRYFGDQTEVRGDLTGQISPMSCAKAQMIFGYRPRFQWSISQRYMEEK